MKLSEWLVGAATLIGTGIAFYSIGYASGKDTNDRIRSYVEKENDDLKEHRTRLASELEAVKRELAALPGKSDVPEPTGKPAAGQRDPADGSFTQVTIKSGASKFLPDSGLTLSLVGVSFRGSPLRHQVVAAVAAPDSEKNTVFDNADVGDFVIVDGFQVRVMAASTFEATFGVRAQM